MEVVTMAKTTEDVRKDAGIICKNLAPLVGCRFSEIGWAPIVGVNVCKALTVAGTEVSNVASESVTLDRITFQYDAYSSLEMNAIWKKALAYDPSVLNSSYIMYIENRIPAEDTMQSKLHLTSMYCKYTDSTLYDAITTGAKSVRLTPHYNQVCHLILAAFCLRYYLFEYSYNGKDLDTIAVSSKLIRKVINNIDYVKYVLSNLESNDVSFVGSQGYLMKQLTFLRMSVQMIEPYVLRYAG